MTVLIIISAIAIGLVLLLYLDSPIRLLLINIYQETAVKKARRYVLLISIILSIVTITIIPYRIVKKYQNHNGELTSIEADLKWPTNDQQARSIVERIPDKPQTQITLIARDSNTTFTTVLNNTELIIIHNSIKAIVDELAKENMKKK